MTSPFDQVDLEALRRRRTVKWSLYGPDVLAAWVAEMDFDVAPPVRQALLDAIDREDFGYVVADTSELTRVCADFFSTAYDWEVPPTRIFLVADVLTGIAGALDQFVPAGRPVIVPAPAYPPLFEIVELGGRPVVEVPLVDDVDHVTESHLDTAPRPTLDLDAIDAAFSAGARALLLCNPHNPTGRVFTVDELTALADVVERHGARVVADEVHAPLVHRGHRHVPYATVSAAAADHTVTVTSVSKAWNLAGLKCAQVVMTSHADAALWRRLPVFAVHGPTPLGIATSTAAYVDGRAWLHDLVTHLDGNRRRLGELLRSELPDIPYRAPEGTYLAWLDCSALGVEDPAAFFLHEAGVALSDGPPFRGGCPQHVRLNFATSRALLEQIVSAMGAAARSRT